MTFFFKKILFLALLCISSVSAQMGFSHELGVIGGPIAMRSDFGERNDFETNASNSGYGVGIIHYINFSYRADCNCYTTDNFWNDHVKLRTEISYTAAKLDHHGKWVDESRKTESAERLRRHKGAVSNIDFGTQFELYLRSIRSFQAFGFRFNPYLSLGAHFTSYSPEVSTTYGDGDSENPYNFLQAWYQREAYEPISDDPGGVFSIVASTGVRYKLTMLSDLVLDLRWQYFGNDWIDGLNHSLKSNKSNDWLNWLSVGYIYYLD